MAAIRGKRAGRPFVPEKIASSGDTEFQDLLKIGMPHLRESNPLSKPIS
jgi:hypothetical protein